MVDISITWKDRGKWVMFDVSDINHLSRNHAINLFSFKIPVIAKQDKTYIVNNDQLYEQYQRKGTPVKLFSELQPSEDPLQKVGFI